MALEGGALAGAIIGGLIGGIILLVVIMILYCCCKYRKDNQTATPLPVSYEKKAEMKVGGMNIFPAVSALFKSLPSSTRRNLVVKGQTPKKEIIEDWYDHYGENPYKIEEVVPGKVWSVQYTLENFFDFDPNGKAMSKMFGMDFTDEQAVARILNTAEAFGKDVLEQTKKDIERVKYLEKLVEEKGKTLETIKEVGPTKLYMAVVKLNNGDVLLYSPVRIRDDVEFGPWLDKIGPVKYVVLGSSAHTLMIPTTMKRYPDATYVASKDAWDKLIHVKGWTKNKADFEYDNAESLDRLNNLLVREGVKFHYVKGDMATQAVIPIAHNTALECDIVYSLSNGGFLDMSREELLFDEKKGGERLFYLALACKPISPNGQLPIYRYWMMDPCSPMSMMNPSLVAKDGSDCPQMAQSLRTILAERIDHACGVHTGPISGELFKTSVDCNWSWLDGQSLL